MTMFWKNGLNLIWLIGLVTLVLIQWKRSADDPCGRVVMWDTRGFENIHSGEHQSLLLRYILEGRLHPQNLQQALLLSDETCKKRWVSSFYLIESSSKWNIRTQKSKKNLFLTWRYKNVVKDNQIDLILYVASADEKPDLKLFRAIQKARGESKDEKIKSKLWAEVRKITKKSKEHQFYWRWQKWICCPRRRRATSATVYPISTPRATRFSTMANSCTM